MYDQKLYDRIVAQIVKDEATGCWNWTGPYHKERPYPSNRYGYINVMRRGKSRSVNTHRAMWIALDGEIESTVYICHTCDNPLCANPEHLFAGTPKDNTHDMLAKNRHNNGRKTHCKRGHELAGENVWVDKKGLRHCKVCGRERQLRRWHSDPELRARQYAQRRQKAAAKRSQDQLSGDDNALA